MIEIPRNVLGDNKGRVGGAGYNSFVPSEVAYMYMKFKGSQGESG